MRNTDIVRKLAALEARIDELYKEKSIKTVKKAVTKTKKVSKKKTAKKKES